MVFFCFYAFVKSGQCYFKSSMFLLFDYESLWTENSNDKKMAQLYRS